MCFKNLMPEGWGKDEYRWFGFCCNLSRGSNELPTCKCEQSVSTTLRERQNLLAIFKEVFPSLAVSSWALTLVCDAGAAEVQFDQLTAVDDASPDHRVPHLSAGEAQHLHKPENTVIQ